MRNVYSAWIVAEESALFYPVCWVFELYPIHDITSLAVGILPLRERNINCLECYAMFRSEPFFRLLLDANCETLKNST